jgi:hypothetical protein
MNTNTLELTQWDHSVIYYLKRHERRTITDIKNIWRERCGLDIDYPISSGDLINHFLPIVLKIGELSKSTKYSATSIIIDAALDDAWMFHDMVSGTDEDSDSPDVTDIYYNRIFTVICSRLRLCDVKYLPGFREYYEQMKANCVICEENPLISPRRLLLS